MNKSFLFGIICGFAMLLLMAATQETNIKDLPVSTSLALTDHVVVVTNASKTRLASLTTLRTSLSSPTNDWGFGGGLKLSGKTNVIGDNGSAITFNGVAVGGGDTLWTNDNGVLTTSSPLQTDTPLRRVHLGLGTGGSTALFSVDSSSDLESITGIFGTSSSPASDVGTEDKALYWNGNLYGVVGEGNLSSLQTVGVFGAADLSITNSLNYGVAGFASQSASSQTNVAVAGSSDAASAVAVGGYFEVANGYNTPSDPVLTSAVLLLDNRTNNAVPVFIARTNGTATFK